MKKLLPGSLLLLTLVAPWSIDSALAQRQEIDRIAAIVDDDIILLSEVDDRMQQVQASLRSQNRELPEDEVRREVLDRLILESIQLQKGRRVGVRIGDDQLNEAITRLAGQNNLTLEQFAQALASDGMDYANFREQIRDELMLQRVQQGNVNQRVSITDQEIDTFLESAEGQALVAPQYRVMHALMPLPSDASADTLAQAQAQMEARLNRLQEGASFADATGGLQSGDLGWRKPDELPSLFAQVVPQLQPGQAAAPIRSPSGLHLIQLAERRGIGEMVRQSHVRHILVKPSAVRNDEQTQALLQKLRDRIQAGESFTQLARDYSEDIGTAQEGGDLGWANPGQFVPEFEQQMGDTAIGQISQPFQSQFGWHILQVLERRDHDVSDLIARNRARNYLYQRKFRDELAIWLQKIRDEAYVDIKL